MTIYLCMSTIWIGAGAHGTADGRWFSSRVRGPFTTAAALPLRIPFALHSRSRNQCSIIGQNITVFSVCWESEPSSFSTTLFDMYLRLFLGWRNLTHGRKLMYGNR